MVPIHMQGLHEIRWESGGPVDTWGVMNGSAQAGAPKTKCHILCYVLEGGYYID